MIQQFLQVGLYARKLGGQFLVLRRVVGQAVHGSLEACEHDLVVRDAFLDFIDTDLAVFGYAAQFLAERVDDAVYVIPRNVEIVNSHNTLFIVFQELRFFRVVYGLLVAGYVGEFLAVGGNGGNVAFHVPFGGSQLGNHAVVRLDVGIDLADVLERLLASDVRAGSDRRDFLGEPSGGIFDFALEPPEPVPRVGVRVVEHVDVVVRVGIVPRVLGHGRVHLERVVYLVTGRQRVARDLVYRVGGVGNRGGVRGHGPLVVLVHPEGERVGMRLEAECLFVILDVDYPVERVVRRHVDYVAD